MKFFRFLLLGVGAVVVLLLLVVGLVLNSDFQTWAARKALAAHPEFKSSVGRLEVGLNHVHLEQVYSVREGVVLTLPMADVDLPLLAAARQNIEIKKLVAKGWTLDLTKASPKTVAGILEGLRASEPAVRGPSFSILSSAYAADPRPKPAFAGIFDQLKLPIDLSVDAIELEGEIIFPGAAGQPPGRAKVVLTGGQLGAKREGKFNFTAQTTLAETAPVSALNASGTLTAVMDTPRTFVRIGAVIDAEARGAQFPNGTKLALKLDADRTTTGENYQLNAETPRRRVVALAANFPAASAGERQLKGTWTLDVSDGDIAPFALGRPLSVFTAKGTGKFESDVTLTFFSGSGRLDATADKLGQLRPELAAIGAVQLLADFDLHQDGKAVRVTSLAIELAGSRPVIALRSLQEFEFNPKTGELKVADPSKDLVALDLKGVPLAWFQAFVKDLTVTGEDVQGAWIVGARGGGFAFRSTAPLTVNALSVAKKGQSMLSAVNVSLRLSADYTPQGWQAELAEMSAQSGGVSLLVLDAKAGQLAGKDQPIKATGHWTANLPALLAQPAAGLTGLIRGQAAGEFAASFGSKQEIQAKLAITGLTADPKLTAETLPTIQADVRADIDSAGKITVNAPVLIERAGRKSDLTLAGTLTSNTAGMTIDARVTSVFLATDDAQVLALPFAGKNGVAAKTNQPAGRDERPVWSGFNGQVALALKKVTHQQKFEVTDLNGVLRIEAGSFKLDGISAGLGEGSGLKLNGEITFEASRKEPYALSADFGLSNFDPAPLLRALDPGKPATIEGRFDATSRLTGTGINLAQVVERTRGEFQLSSKAGIFRALRADLSDKLQKTQTAVAALGGLLGAVTKKESISDFANKTQIVSDIAAALAEIPFDQLNVVVARDATLNFILRDFTLISPEVRLKGTGEIRAEDKKPILAQPLDLRLQLAARGRLADLMTRASLVDGRQDNLGYVGFSVPIHLAGSLESPDTSELKNALLKAAGGSLLNNLLGK